MHYKMRSFAAQKKTGKVFVTVAASNVRPLRYERVEYGAGLKTLEEKIKSLANSIWNGDIHPNRSCNHKEWWEACIKADSLLGIRYTSWEKDRDYELDRWSGLVPLVEEALSGMFFGTPLSLTLLNRIQKYDQESLLAYDAAAEEYWKSGKIIVQSAIRASYIKDADIVWTESGDCFLVHADHYNSRGVLDNADGSAINITGLGEDCVKALSYGLATEESLEKIPWDSFAGFQIEYELI